MNPWTPGSFLLALIGVLLAAAAFGWLIQRIHPSKKPPENPLAWTLRHEKRQLRGSIGILLGLALSLVAYPLSCRLGLTANTFGLSDQALTFLILAGCGLLAPVYLGWRGKK